jgi:hypothetical protein
MPRSGLRFAKSLGRGRTRERLKSTLCGHSGPTVCDNPDERLGKIILLHSEPISDRQPQAKQQNDAGDCLDCRDDFEHTRKSFNGVGIDEILPETQYSEGIGETKADRSGVF